MFDHETVWYCHEDAIKMVQSGHNSLAEFKWYTSLHPSETVHGYKIIEEKYDRFPIYRFVTKEEYDDHQKNYIECHKWFPEGKVEYQEEWDDIDDSYVMRCVYNKLEDGTIVVRLLMPGESEKYIIDIRKLFLNKKV